MGNGDSFVLKKVIFEEDDERNRDKSEHDGSQNEDSRTVSMRSKDRVDSNLLES